MKIFIDAGHGAHDSGAAANGLLEKNLNLVVAKEVKRLLNLHNITVLMSREEDTYPTLSNRAKMANEANANYFISIHHNAGGGDGYEIIHSINEGQGKELSEKIGIEFEKIGQNKRKIYSRKDSKGKDYYATIRLTSMPSIITEFGFIDSKDKEIFDEHVELLSEAKAIANGILKHLGIANIEDEFITSVNKLVNKGIINSPDYWINNAVAGKVVKGEYVEILIKRISKLFM